ncbi:MAG: inositol monophosphatase family protein [Fluviibacter sp.]
MSAPLISETALWATCAIQLNQALATLAHQEVMPRFSHARVCTKDDGSLLSDADLAVQNALPDILSEIFPAPLLGEEMPASAQRQLWEDCQRGETPLWIADPIDGTTNFANRLPWFAISVALVHQGSTVLGATIAPALGQNWHASLGGGSFCNGTRLTLGQEPRRLKDCVVGVDMTYLPAHLRQQIAHISPAGITREDGQSAPWRGWRSLGASTLEWCALASGQLNAYVHGGQMPWDAAAGRLILSEAGGHSDKLVHVLGLSEQDTTLSPTGYAAAAPGVWNTWQQWLRDQAG